jgi:hypothetical protein
MLSAAFAAHVAEESQGFAAWVGRNASPDDTTADFVQINAFGLALTFAAIRSDAIQPAGGCSSPSTR